VVSWGRLIQLARGSFCHASSRTFMPIFGRYEVVEQLHAGPAASVSRAKLVDGRGAHFVVKVAHFDDADAENLRQRV